MINITVTPENPGTERKGMIVFTATVASTSDAQHPTQNAKLTFAITEADFAKIPGDAAAKKQKICVELAKRYIKYYLKRNITVNTAPVQFNNVNPDSFNG